MIAVPDRPYMTPDEYLEWEAKQEVRHEYLNGEVHAMTGGTLPHNTIAINLTSLLKQPVRSRGCRLFIKRLIFISPFAPDDSVSALLYEAIGSDKFR